MKIDQFLAKLASADPTPGGGSASALAGSIGAALLSMVAKLSVKEHPEAKQVSQEAEKLVELCRRLAEEDEKAFNLVVAAYKLPKTTDKQKENRSMQIEEALKKATDVPMNTAKTALKVIRLADNFLSSTSTHVLSDLGVATLLTRAAAEGAVLNVLTNIIALKDKHFGHNYIRHAEAVVEEGRNRTGRIIQEIHRILRKELDKSFTL